MPKIILFGANGMLGRYLYTFLQSLDPIPVTRQQFDPLVSNLQDLDILIAKHGSGGAIIINCIGMIPQREGTTPAQYIRVNGEFPHLLNAVSERHNCHLIHITTDCVYDGERGQYTELDTPTETNIYGMSKSLGDILSRATVIRTSIIGEEIENKKSLLEWVKSQEGKSIRGYVNHYWNGVTCLQLAKIIDQIIKNNEYWEGVRHIFSPNIVSKHKLVSMIVDVYRLGIHVNEHMTDRKCDKTLSTIHDTNTRFGILDLSDQITELYQFKLLDSKLSV